MNNPYYGPGAPTPYRPQAYGPPLKNPYKRAVRKNANIVCAALIMINPLAYMISYSIMIPLYLLFPVDVIADMHPAISELLNMTVYTFCFAVPILAVMLLTKIPPGTAFPLRKMRLSIAIPAVFFCLGVSFLGTYLADFISMFFEQAIGYEPAMPDLAVPDGIPARILYFISVAIFPAFLEEFMFRGVIMQSLRRYGDSFALITSAIMFSFCHENLVQGPPTLLVGLAIGYFVMRTGSIWIGVIVHFANNAFAVLVDFLPETMTALQEAVFSAVYVIIYLVGAIVSLIFLILKHPRMFRTIPSNYPLTEPQKHVTYYTAPLGIVYVILTIIYTARNFV